MGSTGQTISSWRDFDPGFGQELCWKFCKDGQGLEKLGEGCARVVKSFRQKVLIQAGLI